MPENNYLNKVQAKLIFLLNWLNKPLFTRKKIVPSGQPILLVQGYGEPSFLFMLGVYFNLRKNGKNPYLINLYINIRDMKKQAQKIEKRINQILEVTGYDKVDYVAHSMGGLIGRYYIQNLEGYKKVDHYVSIATPHYGTISAWFGIGKGAKQMKRGSNFLKELNDPNNIKKEVKYTSIWTNTDQIVLPNSSAIFEYSEKLPPIRYTGHLMILFSRRTYAQVIQALEK